MTRVRRGAAAGEAFLMYILIGSSCVSIGASLPQLIERFGTDLVAVTALGSAYAVGRLITVYFVGVATEKLSPKLALGAGQLLVLCFFLGIASAPSVPVAMAFAFLGGAGMSAQDAACPVVLTQVFPNHYPSAISAGQACFGAGCFLPPLVMSFVLGAGLPFTITYYVFAALAVVALALLPLMKLEKVRYDAPEFKPPKGEKRVGLWVLLGVASVCYCAATNTLNLYTATYAASLGIPADQAVNVMTLFNVGSMVGSFLFAAIMRRVKPATIFCTNLAAALVCLALGLLTRSFWALVASYFFAGMFLGVLFGVMVTLAVGLAAGRAGRAGSIVALMSGSADTVTPLVSGAIITVAGIAFNVWFAMGMIVIALVAAVAFAGLAKRRKIS